MLNQNVAVFQNVRGRRARNIRDSSCIVHETEPHIALLARLPHHTFPAPPTHLTIRIKTSSNSLRRRNDGLARHHDMASVLTDDLKIVLFEDAADVSPRKDAEFTHGPLRSE